MKVAILIDGTFFLYRYTHFFGNPLEKDPRKVADILYRMSLAHVGMHTGRNHLKLKSLNELYRIFYYDCLPLTKKAHLPISRKATNFAKSNLYTFKVIFIKELKKKRKVALRLGHLKDDNKWALKNASLRNLLSGRTEFSQLKDVDFKYDIRQKGVDLRIGIDIASLAYKNLVDRIILVSGDSDFVPAAKVARREGIDFILDPLWQNIDETLFEHIDGLKSVWKKPISHSLD